MSSETPEAQCGCMGKATFNMLRTHRSSRLQQTSVVSTLVHSNFRFARLSYAPVLQRSGTSESALYHFLSGFLS